MSAPSPARRYGALMALAQRLHLEMAGSRSPGYTSAYAILTGRFGYTGSMAEVAADVALDLAPLKDRICHSWR